jgi:adenylate kinase family enzyme
MREVFLPRADWVLSGSIDGWGSELNDAIDLVVFVSTPTDIRVARLRDREARHFGAEAIAEGGWRHQEAEEFFDWALHYEDGTREGRSRSRHETWLAALRCPIFPVDGSRPLEEIVGEVVQFWLSKP